MRSACPVKPVAVQEACAARGVSGDEEDADIMSCSESVKAMAKGPSSL